MRTLVSCSTAWMTGAGPAHHDGLIRSLPVARDVHPGVVRNREEGRAAEISRDVDEHDRVGALGPRRPLGGVARRDPAVGPHHQGVDGLRFSRCRGRDRGPGRELRKGITDAFDVPVETVLQDQDADGAASHQQSEE